MNKDSGGSKPPREDRDRDDAGTTGNAAVKGGKPSPGDRGEASSDDDRAAIDLDSAHDRAS